MASSARNPLMRWPTIKRMVGRGTMPWRMKWANGAGMDMQVMVRGFCWA